MDTSVMISWYNKGIKVYAIRGIAVPNSSIDCKGVNSMSPKYTTKHINLFWTKVNRTDNPDDCWEWQAGKVGKMGYGQFTIGKKHYRAHRLSWELANGEVPEGLWVLHRCDNPVCVNPTHLFLGTQLDNEKDKVSKNRQVRGENVSLSKLKPSQVREIRSRYVYRSADNNIYTLAREFEVTPALIALIVKNEIWKQVD